MKNTMSAYTNPRSAIQLVMEFNNALTILKKGIQNILENYKVVNNTFAYINGSCQEITEGYFTIETTKDTLDEAIQEVKDYRMGIRIIEENGSNKFEVGHIQFSWDSVSDITESRVVDLSLGEIVK